MKKGFVLRQLFTVTICIWTVILLCLQFAPRSMQNTVSSDADGARSYTVPPVQQTELQTQPTNNNPQTAQTETATLPVTTSAEATTQKVLPANKTQEKNKDFVAAQPTMTQTVPATSAQAVVTDPTQPDSNEAALQESTTIMSSLPVADMTPVADSGETTLRPLRFGAQVTTALPGDGLGVVYVLTVTERGSIRYTLGYPSNGPFSEIGWKITLYEEYDRLGSNGGTAYRMLNILSSSVATTSVTSSAIGVQPGTYRLVLEQNGDFSKEEITVLAEFTAETNRESEPNDTPARYTELYSDSSVIGSSSKYETATNTDLDWYMFRMPYDGYAHYTFTHDAMDMVSVGWQIYLYDEALNPLSFNNAAIAEGSVTGEKVGLAEGVYFICIKGRVHSTQDYAVKVDTVRADLSEYESNDTFATATRIQPGKQYTGMMNSREQGIDIDCFVVELTKAGSLQVTFRHAALSEDQDGWNVSLLNADGEVLDSFISNWMDTINISPELGVAAGTYYVRIDSDNRYFTSEPYTVEITHTNDTGFEAEPNNTAAKASETVLGKPVKGSLTQTGLDTDTDFFVVHIGTDGNFCLTFSHEKVNLDRLGWSITLMDADGNVFTPMDKNGLPLTNAAGAIRNDLAVNWNQSQASAYYRLKSGDYYIRVTAAEYFSSETYTLLMKETN